jgi:NADH-quinone oxidoreductase subunit M
MLLIPLIGAGAILFMAGEHRSNVRSVAVTTSMLTLIVALSLLNGFETTSSAFQFEESVVWNARMGTAYALGLDGFSYPMVLLATLLSLVAILASGMITERYRGYYALVLVLESAMLGVFMARDWLLFYVFWEMTIIPLFFLIDRWGGERRSVAALNFVLYTMGGSVFMLVSLLVLYDAMPEPSFSMAAMNTAAQGLAPDTQLLLFLGFLIGFGVKMPIFPIHGWLPLAHVEAPSPISILLSGILLKMGSYGLIRAAGMLPAAVVELQGVLATLALFSLFYGGLLAWRQSDLKAMIAYSSVGQMGIVLFGIAAINVAGLTGAMMQMVAHGLVAGATFMLIGLLYQRTHSRNVNDYSSLIRVTPRLALLTTLALFGAIGLPGSATFIAKFFATIGGFQQWGIWIAMLVGASVLVSGAYVIRTIGILFTGPSRPEMAKIKDLQTAELAAAGVLVVGTLILGFFPQLMLNLMGASIDQMISLFDGVAS